MMLTGLFSSSPKSDQDSDNKRNLSDTSILENTENLNPEAKRLANESRDSSFESKTLEQTMIKSMEAMFQAMSDKFDKSLNKFESRLDDILVKFEGLDSRITSIGERSSSQQIIIDNMDSRVGDLETRVEHLSGRIENTIPNWEPAGSPSVKIALFGDSNSGGKIKFGEGKGTLGAALPGKDVFTAKLENLPDPQSDDLADVSDLVTAVGTNDLKEAGCIPAELAKVTYSYVSGFVASHPSTHVFLPGVLPTTQLNFACRHPHNPT